MKNTENTTAPAGYSRSSLIDALRGVVNHPCRQLVLHPLGWHAVPARLVAATSDLALLDYEGLLEATPDESPEDYTEETYEGLAEWIESHVEEWASEAIDWEKERIEEATVDPNATTWRLEALRKILSNLKRA